MIRSSLLFIFFIGAMTAMIFFVSTPEDILPENIQQEADMSKLPDAIAIAHTTTYFNEEGEISSKVIADKLEYFSNRDAPLSLEFINDSSRQNFAYLTRPDITFIQEENTWRLNAFEGIIYDTSQSGVFNGNVTLIQTSSDEDVTMTTQSITIFMEQKIASTDDDIIISTREGKLSATGMKADLSKQTIQLLDQVRGEHAPL